MIPVHSLPVLLLGCEDVLAQKSLAVSNHYIQLQLPSLVPPCARRHQSRPNKREKGIANMGDFVSLVGAIASPSGLKQPKNPSVLVAASKHLETPTSQSIMSVNMTSTVTLIPTKMTTFARNVRQILSSIAIAMSSLSDEEDLALIARTGSTFPRAVTTAVPT